MLYPTLRHRIMVCYTTLYIALCYIILYCIVLYYTIQYYVIWIILYHVKLYYIILYYIVLYCIVSRCIVLYCIVCRCTLLGYVWRSRRTSQEKDTDFFGHERSDLAFQNDDFLKDTVIFVFFARNPCVCNGSGSGLGIFDFGPEPRKHKNQNKILLRDLICADLYIFFWSEKRDNKIWADQVPEQVFSFIFMFSWFRPKIGNSQTTARTIAHARFPEKTTENDRIHQKVIILQSQIASFVTKEFGVFFLGRASASSHATQYNTMADDKIQHTTIQYNTIQDEAIQHE